ncbi:MULTISPECIES: hypothetical protein [Sphingobacterium]|uniref:hypothetical protein n=1 Tax=Sphingobacterium TaxID=28453 RepID=UPI000E0685CF|nr:MULTISPECIES: hypothetical protein [Sphingobacterium]QQT43240.1 hypothetical protein I6J00_15925 [Sphingobacterium multivorum]SUI99041.1 Uncharacterised protein [Sphingobacterium multivorum]
MKIIKLSYLLLTLLIFSCGKDGAIGVDGKQGEKGEQGIKGNDGNTILSGDVDPTMSVGKNGDFYLNLKTAKLFGPKSQSGWGAGVGLSGNDGKDGANGTNGNDGNTILSGNSVPSSSIGKIGDFYINISKMDFFGPKSQSGWGNPVSLKPQDQLTKRVLVKENFPYSKNCSSCINYSTTWLPGYSTFSATSADYFISTGNIQDYYDKGIVTYEASINNGEWFILDPNYNKDLTKQFVINGREYMVTFMPSLTKYYKDSNKLFIGSDRMIMVRGNYTKSQLISWLDNDVTINIRITLLPKETIELLSKAYPYYKIDNSFISKYLLVQ